MRGPAKVDLKIVKVTSGHHRIMGQSFASVRNSSLPREPMLAPRADDGASIHSENRQPVGKPLDCRIVRSVI
jgi:hypothetical protein